MTRTPQDKVDERFVATVLAILPPKLSVIGIAAACRAVITKYLNAEGAKYVTFLLNEALVEYYNGEPDDWVVCDCPKCTAKRKAKAH